MKRVLIGAGALALVLYGSTFLTRERANGEWMSAASVAASTEEAEALGAPAVVRVVPAPRRGQAATPPPPAPIVAEQVADDADASVAEPAEASPARDARPARRARAASAVPSRPRVAPRPARVQEPIQFSLAERG